MPPSFRTLKVFDSRNMPPRLANAFKDWANAGKWVGAKGAQNESFIFWVVDEGHSVHGTWASWIGDKLSQDIDRWLLKEGAALEEHVIILFRWTRA